MFIENLLENFRIRQNVFFCNGFDFIEFINFVSFLLVQQRFVLTGVLFLALGVNFTLRMIFPLILTQMVYVPGSNNETSGSNGELVCPIRYELKVDTVQSVRTKCLIESDKINIDTLSHFQLYNRLEKIQTDMNGLKSCRVLFCQASTGAIWCLKCL